jgi:hypothetical protein
MSRFYIQLSWRESSFREQIIPAARRAKLFLSAKKTRTFEIFTRSIHEPVRKEFRLMPWLNWQRRFWYYLAFCLNRVSWVVSSIGLWCGAGCDRTWFCAIIIRKPAPYCVCGEDQNARRVRYRPEWAPAEERKSIQFNPSVAVGVISGAPTMTHSSLSLHTSLFPFSSVSANPSEWDAGPDWDFGRFSPVRPCSIPFVLVSCIFPWVTLSQEWNLKYFRPERIILSCF